MVRIEMMHYHIGIALVVLQVIEHIAPPHIYTLLYSHITQHVFYDHSILFCSGRSQCVVRCGRGQIVGKGPVTARSGD